MATGSRVPYGGLVQVLPGPWQGQLSCGTAAAALALRRAASADSFWPVASCHDGGSGSGLALNGSFHAVGGGRALSTGGDNTRKSIAADHLGGDGGVCPKPSMAQAAAAAEGAAAEQGAVRTGGTVATATSTDMTSSCPRTTSIPLGVRGQRPAVLDISRVEDVCSPKTAAARFYWPSPTSSAGSSRKTLFKGCSAIEARARTSAASTPLLPLGDLDRRVAEFQAAVRRARPTDSHRAAAAAMLAAKASEYASRARRERQENEWLQQELLLPYGLSAALWSVG